MFDNPFQAGLLTIFIVSAISGVAIFSINPGLFGVGGGQKTVSAEVWGTISQEDFSATLAGAGIPDDETITIDYTEVDPQNVRSRLVNQLAQDQGPDALLIPHTQLLQLKEFLITFDSQTYNRRTLRNNFVQGAEVFSDQDGVTGLPFAMDPLVMYWNRDIVTSAGFVSPPETWSDVQEYIDAITEVDETQNISQAAIALGTAKNINESKAILSSMLQQAGNPIIEYSGGSYRSVLAGGSEYSQQAEAAVRLYTQYANPRANSYTWNSTFNMDRQSFISNQLAMYFDTGQAVTDIRERNPNLNFDVTQIPQRENKQPRTYAKFYGLVMLEDVNQRRRANVFAALQRLVSRPLSESLLENTNLTPVRKSVIARASPDSPQKQTYLNIAPTARAWLEPNPSQATEIFKDLITDITSGRSSIVDSISNADSRLRNLLD